MPGPYKPDVTEEEKRLDDALCNFCNHVNAPFEPVDKWNEAVEKGYVRLRIAYNEWYARKLMQQR